MADRQNVKVSFYQENIFGSVTDREKYKPDSIKQLIGWLTDKLQEVPPEYADTAKFEIESVGGYEGEHHSEIELYYHRPETDEEMAARVARYRANVEAELKRHEQYAAQARAALSRL
jgi:hypothetical protein